MDPRAPGGAGPGQRGAPAGSCLSSATGQRLGVSFSPRRAVARGLDWRLAFQRLLELELSPIRLSAYWDATDEAGYSELDWLLAAAEQRGREVVLTVGIKAQGWPEFFVPARLSCDAASGSDVVAAVPAVGHAALPFIAATVERYRQRAGIVAWQVENEPLNPSGPRRWWIGPGFVSREVAAVREGDPGRPVVVNAFCHFNARLDAASSRHGADLRRLLGSSARTPEAEALALLAPGDILGLDVYRRIGRGRFVTHAWGWRRNAERWRRQAAAEGKHAWVVEAQAEPWHGSQTCRPEDIPSLVAGLRAAGLTTILLWGAEHWIAEAERGDPSWLAAVGRLPTDQR